MESETQKAIVSDATLGNPLKRKANHCDGTDCSSPRSKLRDRVSESDSDIPAELLTGKHMCIKCSQRIALTDEKGFTLAHWLAHLLVCDQSRLVYSADQGGGAESENSQVSPQLILAENVAISSDSDTKAQTITPMSGIYLNAKKDAELLQNLRSNTQENASSDPHSAATINQAGSILKKRRRPNRTEAERKEELLADPNVAEVEPYRILCAVCDKWIKLRRNSRYCSIPWDCHKDSCQKANSRVKKATTTSAPDSQTQHSDLKSTIPAVTSSSVLLSQAPNSSISHLSLTASHPTDLMLPPASSHPSLKIYTSMPLNMSTKSGSMSPNGGSHLDRTSRALSIPRFANAEQRRMALEADPHSEIVEHDRVLCSLCKRWVRLRQNSKYCAAPWRSHIARCAERNERHETSGSGSSDATVALTRKDTMANDRLTTAGSHATMSIERDSKSSYYRKNYNGTLHPANLKGEVKASYYKTPVSPAPQLKPRGRQLKVKALELRPDHSANSSESEVSYESEEA